MLKSFRKRTGAKVSLVLLSIFLFLFIFASAAAAATYGDVNDDGNINVLDVVLVQQHVLGLDELDEDQETVADVNGDGNINVQDVTLIMQYSLGLIDEFPDAALQVVSVEAVNARQVEVTFNKLVNKTKSENESNYEVYLQGAMYTNVFRTTTYGATAVLQDDDKTVLLTLDDTKKFVNGSSFNKVVVKEEVGLTSDYTDSSVTFLDSTAPTLQSAKSIGMSTVALTFSEPVEGTILADRILLTDSYGNELDLDETSARFEDADRQVIIDLVSGYMVYGRTYNITVLSSSGLKDYVGYNVSPGIKQFVHSWETSGISVSATALNEQTVRLTFNRPVYLVDDLTELEFRYNINHTGATKVTGDDLDGLGTDFANSSVEAKTQFDLVFSDPMYIGYGRLYIYSTNHDNSYITDTWGNILPNSTMVEFTVSESTAPRIVHARTIGSEYVVLTYSRSVKTDNMLSTITANQFEYLDSPAVDKEADQISISGNEITLRFPGAAFTSGNDELTHRIRYTKDPIFAGYRIRDAVTDVEAISPDTFTGIYSGF